MRKVVYVYIKGNNYKEYRAEYDGDADILEFEKIFDTLDDLIAFVSTFSDYYSIPVQFYK